MTAAFDADDDYEADVSSQESSAQEPETLLTTLKGRVPVYCKDCDGHYFLNDLTACSVCESSNLVPISIIHFCELCEKDDHDIRWVRNPNSMFETNYFYIPCQKGATAQTPKPGLITSDMSAVTCPKCLDAMGVEIDHFGRKLNLDV